MPRKKKEEPTVTLEKPERIIVATEREAKGITEQLKQAFRTFSCAWYEMGQMVKQALEKQVPEALEMGAHEWMVSVFGENTSIAKIQRSLRIARALEKLPEENVKLLTEGKAYLLTQLRPEDRQEFLEKAASVSNDEFEALVDAKREEYGFKSEGKKVRVGGLVEPSIAEQWNQAENIVAEILEVDLVLYPGKRPIVLEAMAAFFITTPREILVAEMVGAE